MLGSASLVARAKEDSRPLLYETRQGSKGLSTIFLVFLTQLLSARLGGLD